jgi:uncharacterized protein YjbI with pentapeptide repeats
MIDLLAKHSGSVRELLQAQGADVIDLSDGDWNSRFDVLTRLSFEKIRLAKKKIAVDFVHCFFSACEFDMVASDGHFWGASDTWRNCLFHSVTLVSCISPMNSFFQCSFHDVALENYSPYQTLFDDCSFERSVITSFRPKTITNQANKNPDISSHRSSVVFRDCRFKGVTFKESVFVGVAFENCTFDDVTAADCDFTGVVSSYRWWPDQNGDPFRRFLIKVEDTIAAKCGTGSAALFAFRKYKSDYLAGRTQDKNFSACLYSKEVPYAQVLAVEKDIRSLVAKAAL